uniref:Uncharacterized protein n=1 Tax=Knipowitschia caucasica TaxID=637954 RepID=A0AAV2LP87_KNICA
MERRQKAVPANREHLRLSISGEEFASTVSLPGPPPRLSRGLRLLPLLPGPPALNTPEASPNPRIRDPRAVGLPQAPLHHMPRPPCLPLLVSCVVVLSLQVADVVLLCVLDLGWPTRLPARSSARIP